MQEQLGLTQRTHNAELTTGSSILNNKYVLAESIGKGSFGVVYRAVNLQNNGSKKEPYQVAVKVQNDINNINQLFNQVKILKELEIKKNSWNYFPRVYASGNQNGRSFMLMDLLGPNLQDLLILCGGKFSLKTAILLTIQIIQRIEVIHDLGYVYRDIKPQNFLMGTGTASHKLFMVDFGLCKPYRDMNSKMLVPYKEATSMVGTIRYSSLNSHLGIDQSRRDDLQSICYLLIYFLKGELPWQGIASENKFDKDHAIMSYKLKITPQQLCQGLPSEIEDIYDYVKHLNFYSTPDYGYLLSQLTYILESECDVNDYNYDWQKCKREVKLQKTHIDLIIPVDEEFQPQALEEVNQEEEHPQAKIHGDKRTSYRYSKFRDN